MTIRAARVHAYRLPLQAPIETAHQTLERRDGFLLELIDERGEVGVGDACPIDGFGMESLARCRGALLEMSEQSIGIDAERDHANRIEGARLDFLDAPGARAALDTALLDLVARRRGRSIAEVLGAGRRPLRSLAVSTVVAGSSPEEVDASAVRARDAGFGTFKLKVGAGSLDRDVERVGAVRAAVGASARVRLDANAGWSEDAAREALARMASFDVELIEQPVASSDLAGLGRLRGGPIAIAADEAACDEGSALRVIEQHAADLVVLKPAALGGPTAALRVARAARAAGLDVLVTSLLDSAIGVAMAVQVAAVMGAGRPADGLATGRLLSADVAGPSSPVDGCIALPEAPGLGVTIDPAALSKVRIEEAVEFAGG